MPRTRNRLIAAARRSMLQRAELYRRLGIAKAALRPAALVDRGKYRARTKIDDAAHVVQQEFRDNRWPIAIAAAAGITWLLREPIKEHAPKVARKMQDMATGIADHFRADTASEDDEPMEEDDEAAQ
ncbi:hypothetical protein [Sphingopyxis kveilinensis]|uniref:hypothetical protein n=1 Tax=Sphingopyxis kveilinensis TaxID=3114367 RepID=UPI0030D16464